MHRLATFTFGITLSCLLVATAEAQSPAIPPAPAQNPSGDMNFAPPDGATQGDLRHEVPDGFGGLKDLPDDATKADPDSATGSVLITPADPQMILPPNGSDTTGPER
jgi:hypothetical protein